MAPPAISFRDRYTYSDYQSWPAEERWELIEGVAYNMSPAPTRQHQRLVQELSRRIGNFLENRACEVNIAPFDVRLSAEGEESEEIETVVQPDVSVICDRTKLDARGAVGAPDWVIEVLSPATAAKDLNEKLLLYQTHGVREYWVVDPEQEVVKAHQLDAKGRYPVPRIYTKTESIQSYVFPELMIELAGVFAAASPLTEG